MGVNYSIVIELFRAKHIHRMFNNKSVLIASGSCSLGHHYVQTLLATFTPACLIILSSNELKQYEIR